MATDDMHPAIRDALRLGGDPDRLRAYYADWAETYDADIAEGNGVPAGLMGTLVAALHQLDDPSAFEAGRVRVLDAGCGTGLVGVTFHAHGYHDLHGVDLSDDMAAMARRRGIYRSVAGGVDLTDPPAELEDSADIVVLGGVFSVGHVPPTALRAIVGLARPGGLIVASARQAYLDETDFDAVQRALADDGVVELLVHHRAWPYTKDSTGDYYAWRRR